MRQAEAIETISYDIVEDNDASRHFTIGVPFEVWHRATTNSRRLNKATRRLGDKSVRAFTEQKLPDDGRQLEVKLARVGKLRKDIRRGALHTFTELLNSVENAGDEAANPRIHFYLPPYPSRRGDLAHIAVAWPEVQEDTLAEIANESMQKMAVDLGYASLATAKRTVAASINREEYGIELRTEISGGARLDSRHTYYDPESPQITLVGTRIANHEQQFIGLAGALAIARAEELA